MNAQTQSRPAALTPRHSSASWNPVKTLHARLAGMASYRRSADAVQAGNGPHALDTPASSSLDSGLRRNDEWGRNDGLAA